MMSDALALVAFINRWPRVVCTGCARFLLRGERGFAAFDPGTGRPHTPHWCFGCRVALGKAGGGGHLRLDE